MLISQLLQQSIQPELEVIGHQCSRFFEESNGIPLFKCLPVEYSDIQKVKARKRNIQGKFADTFNEAFSSQINSLCQRAIYAYGVDAVDRLKENEDLFYVFPIDGYKYLYSTEVESSSDDYKQVFDMMFEQFGHDRGRQVISDLIKFSYTSTNLYEGIEKGSEIIFYNIPHYHAVRVSTMPDYDQLLTTINQIK